jgi:hypothetical protein
MKTAMQELWDYVKKDTENINPTAYRKLRNKIIPLIAKEKQQIIDAHFDERFDSDLQDAVNYYNETFTEL